MARRSKLPSLEEERQSLESVQENYQQILRRIELAERRIPSQENLGELLEGLNQIAKEVKVDFIQVKFGNSADFGEYIQIPIDIDLRCSLEGLVLYLDGVEQLPRLVKVNFIKITADKDNGSDLSIFLGAEGYALKKS